VRGTRISKASQKLDVVLVAARYDPDTLQLDFAQGYVRRGKVWGDQRLLGRVEILDYLSRGKRVVTGHPTDIPGDFKTFNRVREGGEGSSQVLRSEGSQGQADNLGLPLV